MERKPKTEILDFKHSPCLEYCICSFGYLPGEIPKRTYTMKTEVSVRLLLTPYHVSALQV